MAAKLISNKHTVHIFYRKDNRDRFSYKEPAIALSWDQKKSVEICWGFNRDSFLAEEVSATNSVLEGAKKTITVNAYERNSAARDLCIRRWGLGCVVCEINFENIYGVLGKGFIHVHHLVPLSTIGKEYKLNPMMI